MKFMHLLIALVATSPIDHLRALSNLAEPYDL